MNVYILTVILMVSGSVYGTLFHSDFVAVCCAVVLAVFAMRDVVAYEKRKPRK